MLDELIEKMRPLIWGVVNRRCQGRQDREDAFQNVVAVLCRPDKIRTWFNRQQRGDGAPFCHWVAVVAVHVVVLLLLLPGFDPQDRATVPGELTQQEQAARLRERSGLRWRSFHSTGGWSIA